MHIYDIQYVTQVTAGLPKGEEVGEKLSGCLRIHVNMLLLLTEEKLEGCQMRSFKKEHHTNMTSG